jgi:hypothetical protein
MVYNAKLMACVSYSSFLLRACKMYPAEGKAERTYRHIYVDFIMERCIEDVNNMNRQLRHCLKRGQ